MPTLDKIKCHLGKHSPLMFLVLLKRFKIKTHAKVNYLFQTLDIKGVTGGGSKCGGIVVSLRPIKTNGLRV